MAKSCQDSQGDERQMGADLLPLVYDELRRVAAYQLAHERPGQTLQPTALVHEAWLRLAGKNDHPWKNRAHFISAAAEAIRRILIEKARRKKAAKHGGGWQAITTEGLEIPSRIPDEQLLALDEALAQLRALDPRAAELVNLRVFIGLSQEQAAAQMGISRTTVNRVWVFAQAWLYRRMCMPEQLPAKDQSPSDSRPSGPQ